MRSDGRLVEGMCGLQSVEWEEAQVLNWDELPEASEPLDLIAGKTLDSYPYVKPSNQDLRVQRCRGPMTEELKSMSADGRTTKEIHSRQHTTTGRQEVCVVDAKKHRGPENFRDAVTGQSLDPTLVREARRKELQYFESKGVWHKRPRSEAYKFTGKPPISVKWVDVNKGDDDSPDYRSRLVAREIRQAGEDTIFAPTPPLESIRTVLSMAATDLAGDIKHVRRADSEDRTQIMVLDISRAYFNAKKDEGADPTYVELPAEDSDKAEGMCGLLRVHMYGTRAAADGWHNEYSHTLGGDGVLARRCIGVCVQACRPQTRGQCPRR